MAWKKLARTVLPLTLMLVYTLQVVAESVLIPQGTPVIVQLNEEINSGTHKKGDRIGLTVVSDVMVQGKVVIKAGSPAEGQVESASAKFFAGIGGQIEISVQNTKAVDGKIVPLQFAKETHGGSSLVSIILTVVCCCIFVLIPGKNVKIDKGTIFNATVLGPTEVSVP